MPKEDRETLQENDFAVPMPDTPGAPITAAGVIRIVSAMMASFSGRVRLNNDFILPNYPATPANGIALQLAGKNGRLIVFDGTAWRAYGGSLDLFDHYADAGNGTTVETDLYSDTIPAARLGANGDKLEAEYGGVFVSSVTATRQIKIYFGGTAIFDSGALTLSLSAAWTIYVTIIRVSATVIRYMISMTTEGAALAAYTAVGEVTGLTLSGTNVLKITGQAAGTGAATNDIVAKMGYVEWRSVA